MKADQLCAMKKNQDLMSFTIQQMKINSKLFHFKVGPTPALTASNTVKWSLESVAITDINNHEDIISNKTPFPNWSTHKQMRTSQKRKQQQMLNETNTMLNNISSPEQENTIAVADATTEEEEHSQETGKFEAPVPHHEI
ncbi:uncharacterized protein LOC110712031 [Chenopodium quinoa]|nr:uncharacterized protein LOC110712031 [Chenopodium quinoa]